MELKHLIQHFTYRIAPNPAGGFIAHASDPALPPLEAPTRAELQEKIQANITAALQAEFPGLKLPEPGKSRFAFHVEMKPGGGFSIHSADPSAAPVEGHTHDDLEHPFAEKLAGFVGQHVFPELSQAIAARGGANVTVSVNRKTTLGGIPVSSGAPSGLAGNQSESSQAQVFPAGGSITPSNIQSSGDSIGNAPLAPESSAPSVFLFLLALLAIAGLVYYVLAR